MQPKRNKSTLSILSYFHEKNKDELEKLAENLSDEAREFFDGNIMALLGQIPSELVETTVTMNSNALNHLLYSAMVTGYMTKQIEDKVKLEKLFNNEDDSGDDDETSALIDSIFKKPRNLD